MVANLATCSTLEAFKCHLASELFLLDFLQPISIGVSKELTNIFIQTWPLAIKRLLSKTYENEVTLTG